MAAPAPSAGSLPLALLAAAALVATACFAKPEAHMCSTGIYCPAGATCAARQPLCIWDGCGNGNLDPGEACDDGNKLPGDGCSADCLSTEICGNGVIDKIAGEACDDGNTESGDGCSADCRSLEACGNGTPDPGEDCDGGEGAATGEALATPMCNTNCSWSMCGDGLVNEAAREECDGGDPASPGRRETPTCNSDCTVHTCGDGKRNASAQEECDDGKANGEGADCLATCKLNVCGDGMKHATREECDEGAANGDTGACLTTCRAARCGDGHVRAGVEQCDLGPDSASDQHRCAYGQKACQVCNVCQWRPGIVVGYCGDGGVQSDEGEACDDGANNGSTACGYGAASCEICNSTCTATVAATGPFCGDRKTDASFGEKCDDGPLNWSPYCPNGVKCTLCDSACSRPRTNVGYCGDGHVQSDEGEACDDGANNGSTACAYGTAMCEICNSTCTATVATTGAFCGDRKTDASFGEKCDDGLLNWSPYCPDGVKCTLCNVGCSEQRTNIGYCGDHIAQTENGEEDCDSGWSFSCGTCGRPGEDDACRARPVRGATGSLTIADVELAGVSFTLNDSARTMTFSFVTGVSAPTPTQIAIDDLTAEEIASTTAGVIGRYASNSRIGAAAQGNVVYLTNSMQGSAGNVPIIVSPRDTVALSAEGMSSGAGCGAYWRCSSGGDCTSGTCDMSFCAEGP